MSAGTAQSKHAPWARRLKVMWPSAAAGVLASPPGGQIQRRPLRARQRPAVLGADAGDPVAGIADLKPDPRRCGDVAAAQVPVEKRQLGVAGTG
jgi:hypothetical protein